jgi:hypothetical protein
VTLPEGVALDLGGIAKGMAVDASIALLSSPLDAAARGAMSRQRPGSSLSRTESARSSPRSPQTMRRSPARS